MNTPFVRWLLDIDVIPENASGLELVWEHPWPTWLWVLLLLAAGGFAFWSYSRLTGSRVARMMLAGVRFAVVILVMLVLCGPMLELPRESVEKDWVLVLVDRSASLGIKDAGDIDVVERRRSRAQQLDDILQETSEVWEELDANREVVWLGFSNGAFVLESPPTDDIADSNALPQLGEASGQRTRLNSAVQQALQRAAARPLSGVVVLTDGRTDDPPSRSVLRSLQADQVKVFPVPLGSSDPLGDLAVRRVDAPRRAFIRDKVPIVVELDQFGAAGSGDVTVRLVDTLTGEELDSKTIQPGAADEQITLTAEPKLAGETTWQVVVDSASPDLVPDNNTKPFLIDLVDRPLRVLFVEGYPRWEYRYLKNMLVREKSIESSVMLVSADRDFAQEGNAPITRLPRSPEEFAEFDVIVIGDVPGTFFSPEQLDMIRDHVAERGAGLLWIGGERSTPSTYAGTTLADLLPMRGSLMLPRIEEPVNMVPTELAQRLGVMQLAYGDEIGWPRELAEERFGWSRLFYAQQIEPGRLKPTAEVLAETAYEFSGEPLPLVINMRYGAGQSIYVASDEIWRWRFGRGEHLTEQFWVQMIRLLGRESLTTSGEQIVLQANPRRLAVNQPMRISAQLLDSQLLDSTRATLRATIETANGEPVGEVELRSIEGEEDRYAATYLPDVPGELQVRLDDVSLRGLRPSTVVEVFAPDDELRRPETDHPLLEEFAESTGGRLLNQDTLRDLLDPQVLPNRSVKTRNPLTERIWDTPLVFLLALLLLCVEWVGRKMIRLV